MLRNFEEGHDWLREEFGVTPKVGWQLDTFGHSNVNARLMADMGMDAIFFARMNTDDYDKLAYSGDLEFVWTPEFERLPGSG